MVEDRLEQTRQARRSQRSFLHTSGRISDEEVLVRSNRGNVVPRTDGELPAIVAASQTALNEAGGWVSPEVPLHVLDALEEDLDHSQASRLPCSSKLALLDQNRFAALDPTLRDSSGLRPTSVDGSGVEAFPMTDDAAVQVLEPVRRRPAVTEHASLHPRPAVR